MYFGRNCLFSEEDYAELISLVNAPLEKDIMSYDELKSSLGRWFTKRFLRSIHPGKHNRLYNRFDDDEIFIINMTPISASP